MNTAAYLILGCLLAGRVLSPGGGPAPGVDLVPAATGSVAATTDSLGRFRVELPGVLEDESVVELWRGGAYLSTEVLACDGPRDLWLPLARYELEPVSVVAAPLTLPFETAAVRTEELPRDFAERAAAASPSVAEAVQQLPGVGAVGRDGFTSAPTIRGLGRDRTLVLVEGMRISSDRGVGPSASFLDPYLVERIDVVRGTAGTVYGSGAMGGALRVGLGAAPDSAAASARLGFVTVSDERFVAARAGGSPGNGWRTAAAAFHRTRDDYGYPGGDGLPAGDAANSGFENSGGLVILERPLADGVLRTVLLATDADDVGRPTTIPRRRDTIETEDHLLGTVQFRREDERSRTEAALGFHRPRTVNRTERFEEDGSPARTGRTENESVDLSALLRLERPWQDGGWLAGVDLFARRNVDATETNLFYEAGRPATTQRTELVADAARYDLGAYAGWRRPLRMTGEVVLAARLDWARRSARDRTTTDRVSPSLDLRAVYPLDAHWAVTGAIGRAFRAPRIQELYFEGDRPGGARQANPDLEPEQAWAAEAGVAWGAGPWFSRTALWGLAADRLIVQVPIAAGNDTLRNENLTDGRLFGIEIELAWAAPRARASLAYAYVHGEDSDGHPLPDIPSGELRLSGEMTVWQGPDGPASLWAAGRLGAAKTPADDERWWSDLLGPTAIGGDEAGHPGFARWDLGARLPMGPHARLAVTATNVLDARFIDRPEADAYPQPGRAVTVDLTLRY